MLHITKFFSLYDTLVAMKRYGVLGNYIPAFGQIMGLMQYDLFHILCRTIVTFHELLNAVIDRLAFLTHISKFSGNFPLVIEKQTVFSLLLFLHYGTLETLNPALAFVPFKAVLNKPLPSLW